MAAKNIAVLLLEDVPDVGSAGAVVTVSEGYARNFLFPEGKAALATEAVQQQAQVQAARAAALQQAELTELQSKAEVLDGTELTLTAKVKEGEGEEIFGSITAKMIAEALQAQASLDVSARDIVLFEPIKRLGSYPVTVRLSNTVEAVIQVTVVAEQTDEPEE